MASRSRLPLIGAVLFLALGAAAYFLPTFVPYLAINGINIVENKDIIAIAFGALAAVFVVISLLTGRRKSDDTDEDDSSDESVEAANNTFVQGTELSYGEDGYDVPAFDATESEAFDDEPRKKLTAAEKRELKAAARAEKKRQKQEAKFAKQAAKEAAKAAKAAEKAAKKGGAVDGEILDAETGTDWYKDEDFLSQTVTEAPVEETVDEIIEETLEVEVAVEDAVGSADANWTDAAYTDPNFAVPFADEQIKAEDEPAIEAVEDSAEEDVEVDSAQVADLKAKIAALEAALADQAQSTQLALLELSEATRTNSTARLEWLKDMVAKNDFGDDVVIRMIDLLIRQSKTDEGTVQSALSAIDLRK